MDHERFGLRKCIDGTWAVIDQQSSRVAVVDGHVFKELSLDVARAAACSLNIRFENGPTFH